MKRFLIILAVLAPTCAMAQEKTAQERLFEALGVEWYIANCDEAQQLPAITVMLTAMAINGSTIHDVGATRTAVRDRISSLFTNPLDACASFASAQAGQ